MAETLAANEQAILFLNRRGATTFVICRDCGYVLKCKRCDVPLTYHSADDDLVCHHCNWRTFLPDSCPNCWSGRIKQFGLGTQRVEAVTRQLFPEAEIVRWDRDTTGGKMSHEKILEKFINHEADVMIGTQMIAKGLDLPLVTLVGVMSADTALRLPDFRAGERTFQLLTQVAGRAGRSPLGGKVILQTYAPDHYSIEAASHHDYESFYRQEIEFRRQQGYPPFSRLVRLLYVHRDGERCEQETGRMRDVLENKIARLGLPEIDLIGPAPAFLSRLRGRYRWHLMVRGRDPHGLLEGVDFGRGWRVDVDPVSLL
jgi:primosomal protein N' (replication factor Y)